MAFFEGVQERKMDSLKGGVEETSKGPGSDFWLSVKLDWDEGAWHPVRIKSMITKRDDEINFSMASSAQWSRIIINNCHYNPLP